MRTSQNVPRFKTAFFLHFPLPLFSFSLDIFPSTITLQDDARFTPMGTDFSYPHDDPELETQIPIPELPLPPKSPEKAPAPASLPNESLHTPESAKKQKMESKRREENDYWVQRWCRELTGDRLKAYDEVQFLKKQLLHFFPDYQYDFRALFIRTKILGLREKYPTDLEDYYHGSFDKLYELREELEWFKNIRDEENSQKHLEEILHEIEEKEKEIFEQEFLLGAKEGPKTILSLDDLPKDFHQNYFEKYHMPPNMMSISQNGKKRKKGTNRRLDFSTIEILPPEHKLNQITEEQKQKIWEDIQNSLKEFDHYFSKGPSETYSQEQTEMEQDRDFEFRNGWSIESKNYVYDNFYRVFPHPGKFKNKIGTKKRKITSD